jgi:imidazolonepropionase-like amidohydrolase
MRTGGSLGLASVLLIGWAFAFELRGQVAEESLVLEGVHLVDGTGADVRENARVVITGETISCIGDASSCAAPPNARRIDLSGKWILPGLVDAHVHFAQTGWFDGRPDALDFRDLMPYEQVQAEQKSHPERYYRAYLCSGVTAVFDVGGYPWSWGLRDPAEHDPGAPHVAAAGPLVTHAPRDLLNLPGERQMLDLSSEDAGRAAVRYMAAFRSDAVKVWFLPVREGEETAIDARVLAVGEEATRHRLPLIVHATSLREAKVALRAGARLLVHGIDDAPLDDEFLELARKNGTIYTPTLVVSDGYLRMYEAAKGMAQPRLDDPHRCLDPGTRKKILDSANLGSHPSVRAFARDLAEYRNRLGTSYETKIRNLRKVYEQGLPIAVGTDAGNPGTLHGPSIYSELEAMQEAGIRPRDLLVMATKNGAKAMGRDDIGTVAAGKIADLIVLSENPLADVRALRSLTHVIRAGKIQPIEALAN